MRDGRSRRFQWVVDGDDAAPAPCWPDVDGTLWQDRLRLAMAAELPRQLARLTPLRIIREYRRAHGALRAAATSRSRTRKSRAPRAGVAPPVVAATVVERTGTAPLKHLTWCRRPGLVPALDALARPVRCGVVRLRLGRKLDALGLAGPFRHGALRRIAT